jgi:flagellar motor switch protein FliM
MSDDNAGTLVRGSGILGLRSGRDRDYRVKRYDFKRPDKFSREQVRTMEIIHETFSRLVEVRLSTLLRLKCEAKVDFVDQLTFDEFMVSLPTSTVLATASVKPLVGSILVHVDGSLSTAVLDRLFGAAVAAIKGSDAGAAAPQGLTDIECAAMEAAVGALLPDVAQAWEQLIGIEPRLGQIETDPRFCQIVPPTEMIILVGFELAIGAARGRLHLVYPFITIEPIVEKLKAEYWYAPARPAEASKAARSIAWGVEAPAELVFGGASLSVGELRALRRGSLVAIPGLDEGLGRLRVGGAEVARLRLVGADAKGDILLDALEGGEAVAGPDLEEAEGGGRLDGGLGGLERGFTALREALEATLGKLTERLARIEGREEALVDRLTFGRADEGGDREEPAKRPFEALASVAVDQVAVFLASERPQVTALVLGWLADADASRILDNLPPTTQTEVVRRLATLDWVSPAILAVTDRVLSKKLTSIGSEGKNRGGIDKIVGLLNLTRRATEKNVIESLSIVEPALAEDLKKNMFVFEDISLLDEESIVQLLQRADEADIVLALKPLDRAMREKVLARFEPAAAARLLARVEAMGRVRLSECDGAGQRIVEIVRKLEEEGLIAVLRPGEEE